MSRRLREGFENIPRPVEASACLWCCVRDPRCMARHVVTIATGADWGRDDAATIGAAQRNGGPKATAATIRGAIDSGWIVLDVRGEATAYCPAHADLGLADERSTGLRRWNTAGGGR